MILVFSVNEEKNVLNVMKKWNFIAFQSLLIALYQRANGSKQHKKPKWQWNMPEKFWWDKMVESVHNTIHTLCRAAHKHLSRMHKCTHSGAISKWNFLIYTHRILSQSWHDFVQHVSISSNLFEWNSDFDRKSMFRWPYFDLKYDLDMSIEQIWDGMEMRWDRL